MALDTAKLDGDDRVLPVPRIWLEGHGLFRVAALVVVGLVACSSHAQRVRVYQGDCNIVASDTLDYDAVTFEYQGGGLWQTDVFLRSSGAATWGVQINGNGIRMIWQGHDVGTWSNAPVWALCGGTRRVMWAIPDGYVTPTNNPSATMPYFQCDDMPSDPGCPSGNQRRFGILDMTVADWVALQLSVDASRLGIGDGGSGSGGDPSYHDTWWDPGSGRMNDIWRFFVGDGQPSPAMAMVDDIESIDTRVAGLNTILYTQLTQLGVISNTLSGWSDSIVDDPPTTTDIADYDGPVPAVEDIDIAGTRDGLFEGYEDYSDAFNSDGGNQINPPTYTYTMEGLSFDIDLGHRDLHNVVKPLFQGTWLTLMSLTGIFMITRELRRW